MKHPEITEIVSSFGVKRYAATQGSRKITMSAIEKKHTLTKSCLGCRTSKVKCELTEEHSLSCKRCNRLGLSCVFEESKRGQPSKKRDIARLGPAVRALLRKTEGPDDSNGIGAEALQLEMANTRDADGCLLSWQGNQVSNIWTCFFSKH